ncbi:hypothetical protein PGT21_013399 [Puccinia graminis f. sp. tritici]|uniref:Uncharacterized protein n=1 Tax=Puccinia graminis f. sp. tritici TaxID=56615 RepID=A0A5B0M540_PUCGR|nr:hypothetical protein PGTUg99_020763 [Puccinia graminis f. sp. tritici]KAA1071631.1 hypothetical protein PGT21_013399 [Puccinia graminis f. sp. tritici]
MISIFRSNQIRFFQKRERAGKKTLQSTCHSNHLIAIFPGIFVPTPCPSCFLGIPILSKSSNCGPLGNHWAILIALTAEATSLKKHDPRKFQSYTTRGSTSQISELYY